MLEARLSNKYKIKWGSSNSPEETEEKIFPTEKLLIFLDMSLSDFNQCPLFTNFSFENSKFTEQFSSILVEGAIIYALGSHALVEKVREISVEGAAFTVPPIADLLQEQYARLLILHWEKLKHIKRHIKDFER